MTVIRKCMPIMWPHNYLIIRSTSISTGKKPIFLFHTITLCLRKRKRRLVLKCARYYPPQDSPRLISLVIYILPIIPRIKVFCRMMIPLKLNYNITLSSAMSMLVLLKTIIFMVIKMRYCYGTGSSEWACISSKSLWESFYARIKLFRVMCYHQSLIWS